MSRCKRETQTDPGATAGPFIIDPHGVYRHSHVKTGMGLAKTTLAREIRQGRLRFAMRGGKVFFLGGWLLAWIQAGEVRRRPRAAHATPSAVAPDADLSL
jgi:hypothetical protein